jgi:hypothetical protein
MRFCCVLYLSSFFFFHLPSIMHSHHLYLRRFSFQSTIRCYSTRSACNSPQLPFDLARSINALSDCITNRLMIILQKVFWHGYLCRPWARDCELQVLNLLDSHLFSGYFLSRVFYVRPIHPVLPRQEHLVRFPFGSTWYKFRQPQHDALQKTQCE